MSAPTENGKAPERGKGPQPVPRSRLIVIGVLIVIALVALFFISRDSGGEAPELTYRELSRDELVEVASEASHPVYWVGERPDTRLEFSESRSGRVYVRYLTGDAQAGDEGSEFVTVATYPSEDGVADLRSARDQREGATLGRTADGAVVLVDPSSPYNAYVAVPGEGVQVEVYSPTPGEALRLVNDGLASPVS